MSVEQLPALNATLNGSCALFLLLGYRFIRAGRTAAHRACMLIAVLASVLFMSSYLVYHAQVGSVPYQGQGWIRIVYFTVLLSHTVLATAVVPLVLITLVRALRGRFERHAAIARFTLPIWIYVSITGVIVYLMLYRPGGTP
jgi:uncharacterized membrane protein YozB (DUF420 family)